MKVRITSCIDSRYWYAKKIGEIFDVRRIDSDRYWVKPNPDDPYSGWNFILFKDCETYKEV